ncbi:hypothetical protein DJ010_00855 [Nocardioides silvaticus]|uniref:Protein kinase domain-containing protein n=1 Tax=Nocardioides silvaticus TaxID=2201891 RepID=A0A316TX79_9ACTN|nr:hypothetical protein [Nocardioides silvaticus]PWN04236.1 hypothetical protein DJ010_00855 [Nocardioides silvaticus]
MSADRWMILAGALGGLLAVSGIVLLLWRRQRSRSRRHRPEVEVDPQRLDLPPVWEGAWWADQPERPPVNAPSEVAFTFADLVRRPEEQYRPRMDPRQVLSMAQRERYDEQPRPAWRQTGRTMVHPTRDGDGDVLVLADPVRAGSRDRGLSRLVTRGAAVRDALGSSAQRIELAWPQEAFVDFEGAVLGYFMPRLDDRYVLTLDDGDRAVRTLGTANGLPPAGVPPLDDPDALELVGLLAQWLRALHMAGVVLGDLGWRSVAFAITPMRIRPLDYDAARVLGSAGLLDPDPETEHDPEALAWLSSFDSDSYLFALLAYRLLVSRDHVSMIDVTKVPTQLPGLSKQATSTLRRLWQHASGPKCSRPTMEEWVEALSSISVGAAVVEASGGAAVEAP